MGHHEAAEKEAPDVRMEQIRVGTVSTRLHPRLPPNTTIPWPQNLQIRYEVQSEQRIKMTKESTENAFETEDVESFDKFDAEYMNNEMRRRNKVQHCWSSSSWRSASGADRGSKSKRSRFRTQTRREIALRSPTPTRPITRVTETSATFEMDLNDLIDEGDVVGAKLGAAEQEHLKEQRLTNAVIDMIANLGK